MIEPKKVSVFLTKNLFGIILLVACAARFFYFGEEIDDPHGWRQCDTANYIWDFYKNGIDLFHPSVCWMGNYKTLILEFPLPEAIIAQLYHIFGPYHVVARAFFFVSFLFSVLFLYKTIQFLVNKEIAQLTSIVYTLLPLSFFYSRALNIDFFSLGFALATAFYYLKGIQLSKTKFLWIGTLFAIIALLVKAPYIIVIGVPILIYVIQQKQIIFCLKSAYIFFIPIALFVWWTQYSNTTNGNAPDWNYILGYRKFNNNSNWYYGTLTQRLTGKNWLTILTRIYEETIGGITGIFLFAVGIWSFLKNKKHFLPLFIMLGLIIYTLVFFNLNIIHNYYQIPFLILTSLLIGTGIQFCMQHFSKNSNTILILATLTIATNTFFYSQKNYFKIPLDQVELAKIISENTKPDDLLIVSCNGMSVHCPIILYRAKRNGWSIPNETFDVKAAYKLLAEEKCQYLVYVTAGELSGNLRGFVDFFSGKNIKMSNGQTIYLRDFSKTAEGKTYNPNEYK